MVLLFLLAAGVRFDEDGGVERQKLSEYQG